MFGLSIPQEKRRIGATRLQHLATSQGYRNARSDDPSAHMPPPPLREPPPPPH